MSNNAIQSEVNGNAPETNATIENNVSQAPTVSARLLHKAIGSNKSFIEWVTDVVGRNPIKSRGTGFREEIGPSTDFPVDCNLAISIGMQAQSFGGLIVVHALWKSGIHDAGLLRESPADTLGKLQGLILRPDGLVDARMLQQFLEDNGPFGQWIGFVTLDHFMEWGRTYFSETEVDFWSLLNPNVQFTGELLLSPQLAENIIISHPDPDGTNEYFAFHYFENRDARVLEIHN